jgi:hypothetical protein
MFWLAGAKKIFIRKIILGTTTPVRTSGIFFISETYFFFLLKLGPSRYFCMKKPNFATTGLALLPKWPYSTTRLGSSTSETWFS